TIRDCSITSFRTFSTFSWMARSFFPAAKSWLWSSKKRAMPGSRRDLHLWRRREFDDGSRRSRNRPGGVSRRLHRGARVTPLRALLAGGATRGGVCPISRTRISRSQGGGLALHQHAPPHLDGMGAGNAAAPEIGSLGARARRFFSSRPGR